VHSTLVQTVARDSGKRLSYRKPFIWLLKRVTNCVYICASSPKVTLVGYFRISSPFLTKINRGNSLSPGWDLNPRHSKSNKHLCQSLNHEVWQVHLVVFINTIVFDSQGIHAPLIEYLRLPSLEYPSQFVVFEGLIAFRYLGDATALQYRWCPMLWKSWFQYYVVQECESPILCTR
jgi:hypothetical protein